jgi:hypothetical protein
MCSLVQRCVIRASNSSWAGNMLQTQEGLADPRFRHSASNSSCIRGTTTCICLMHCQGHEHSHIDRIFHLDRNPGPEILSLAMGSPSTVRQSKADKAREALLLLLAALMTAETRRQANLWTIDESWSMLVNPLTGS